MGQRGASIYIIPSWHSENRIIDIAWDDQAVFVAPAPSGEWWGKFALLAGFGTSSGRWHWGKNSGDLFLVVHNPYGPEKRILSILESITFPLVIGRRGPGRLGPNLAPVVGDLSFEWSIGFSSKP